MKFSNCQVEISQYTAKPHVEKTDTELKITLNCPCGEKGGSVTFNRGLESEIVEKINLAYREAQERLTGTAYIPVNVTKPIFDTCTRCGRELTAVVNFHLDKKFLRRSEKRFTEGEREIKYGDVLQIKAYIKRGFFGRFNTTGIGAIFTPQCSCGCVLSFPEIRKTFNEMVERITQIFASTEPQAIKKPKDAEIEEKVKCPACLSKVKLKVQMKADFPERFRSLSEAINLYKKWEERQEILSYQ